MNIGICWPSPDAAAQPLFDARVLQTLRESTGATHLRVNFDHRRSINEIIEHAEHIRAEGFEILPILDFDYDRPNLGDYATVCAALCGLFPAVELGNEPHTMHRMPAEDYAKIFSAGAKAIRSTSPHTQTYIACEATQAPGKPDNYWREVSKRVSSSLYDVAAIHPYRNPREPMYSRFPSRQDEFAYFQSQVPDGTGIAVTEVGWDLRDGVDEQRQADYTYQELGLWQSLGVDAVYLFAFMDSSERSDMNFGILDGQRNPRPVAAAIKQFQRERGMA